jgi:hypothetical protein
VKLSIARALILILPILGAARLPAQTMDDLNLQVHGYVTQSSLYTNHNSWNGTDSENGSAAWTEAVVNLSAQPQPKLRIGVQARYFLLGDYGDTIRLDWAQLDYRFNEHFGIRIGDVKTPTGLLNETQDIDPAHLWSLLPQSVYPIASRDSLLDHYGAVVYGAIPLGEHNKIEYRGYAGTRVIAGADSVFQPLRDEGLSVPNGIRGPIYGATLKWDTPLPGLMLGATEDVEHPSGEIEEGALQGTLQSGRTVAPYLFGQYEGGKFMLGAEYNRTPVNSTIQFPGLPAIPSPVDYRTFYVMSSYKISSKLTAGAYYSSFMNRSAPVSTDRFQKDWTVSARYDFNSYLYAKAEQHFMDGTAVGFNASDNPNIQPTTRLTILKLGVSF